MIEVRIHGRGGQGNVVAAYLLAAAVIRGGYHAQAFPAFGAERRGAPVVAFVRCRERPILRRSAVERPNFAIVQDPALLRLDATLAGLRDDGALLLNAGREAAWNGTSAAARWVGLPATAIAEETIGRPIPNTPLLAAFLTLTGLVPLDALTAVIDERFDAAKAAANRRAVAEAAARVDEGAWADLIHEKQADRVRETTGQGR